MKKILHICTDEKFIDFAIHNFKSIDYVINDFIIISNLDELKYIKSKDVLIFSGWFFIRKILCGYINNYDAIIFHSMTDYFKFVIKLISKKTKICWIGFGFDYYQSNNLLNYHRFIDKVKIVIKNDILKLNNSYKNIDYFCPVLECEFNSVYSRLKLTAKYLDWNYGSSDNIVKKLKSDYVDGDSILLGNSASETNNHFEMIDLLIAKNEKREIIIPLSYGDSNYAKKITTKLESSKLNYTLLMDYLTQDEYFNILRKCSFVIMNHKRQQAAGNILIMLSLGSKVILDTDNPLYGFFEKMGFIIYDKINLNENLSSRLDEEHMLANKKLSLDRFNNSVTIRKTKELIDSLVFN